MPDVAPQAVAPVSAADLTYIAKHPRATVKAQKPRLKVAKQNHIAAMPVCTVAPAVTGTPRRVLSAKPGEDVSTV